MSKDQTKRFIFPRFLLPSPHPKKQPDPQPTGTGTGTVSGTTTNSSPPTKYLNGHISYLSCSTCTAHLCLTSQIISKGFTGRHGRAYLVSAEPLTSAVSVSASSSATASLPNTTLGRAVPRQLVTGAHTVSDVSCAFCASVLGWKYVGAEEESQRYKVGKFILETKKTMATACWEGGVTSDGLGLEASEETELQVVQRGTTAGREREDDEAVHCADVEFDSQDEDECEDLFAGIWSSGLASRRRSRKVERRPTMFGMS